MGRLAGSLVRATCKLCGRVEVVPGCGGKWRCSECKLAGRTHAPVRALPVWCDRENAGSIVGQAVRCGSLPHPRGYACADCGGAATEYEHRDYSKPLDVEPICRKCNLRRGPGMPRPGSYRAMVAAGIEPIRNKVRALKLFATMGLPASLMDDMPKRLRREDWARLVPVVEAKLQERQGGVVGADPGVEFVHGTDSPFFA